MQISTFARIGLIAAILAYSSLNWARNLQSDPIGLDGGVEQDCLRELEPPDVH